MPVTRFDVRLKRPLAGGAAFGDVGPYDELKGTLRFSIDPKHAANERITDVALAPAYSVALSVPLSATHSGEPGEAFVPGEAASPQALTRSGSFRFALPAWSDTRLIWR